MSPPGLANLGGGFRSRPWAEARRSESLSDLPSNILSTLVSGSTRHVLALGRAGQGSREEAGAWGPSQPLMHWVTLSKPGDLPEPQLPQL